MNVLVAGGAGYIGSQVTRDLKLQGHNPIVIDDLSKGHRQAVLDAKLIVGNIGDRELVKDILTTEKIEAVIHLAAFSQVGESVTNPAKYFNNNISNGIALLDAMIASNVKKIVFSSTAAVYGEPITTPITEEHPKNPTNPYGFSKLTFEGIMSNYEQAYGLRYISLRYFNAAGAATDALIGEDHQPESHLIPLVLQTALGLREQLDLYGTDYPTPDGTCIRDYIHIIDLSQAHLLALESLMNYSISNIYNLGNGQGYSNLEVIETAQKITKKPIKINKTSRRPGDPAVLVASATKIQTELGWQPKYPSLETIIETAWKWHSNNPEGYKW